MAKHLFRFELSCTHVLRVQRSIVVQESFGGRRRLALECQDAALFLAIVIQKTLGQLFLVLILYSMLVQVRHSTFAF